VRTPDHWTCFLEEFVTKPSTTGAVAPSSPALTRLMASEPALGTAKTVVEYGPGTGVLTGLLLERMAPDAQFLAIEINPRMATAFRSQYPDVPLAVGSATDVRQLCADAGIDSVDAVMSGLPWSAFSETLQRELLDAMMTVLRPGGFFSTFAYLNGLVTPGGRRFRKLLGEYFSRVSRTRPVWRNVPPATVYRCVR
jgi:phospholipid N-methyltransferase